MRIEHIYVYLDGFLSPALLIRPLEEWDEARDNRGVYRGAVAACMVERDYTVKTLTSIRHVSHSRVAGRYWMRTHEARARFPGHKAIVRPRHKFV